jgi:NitT/TauT family transport system substrate-binding protein
VPTFAQTAPVRVGASLVEESMLAVYAYEKGYFKQNGVDVDLILSSNGGGAITEALLGGSLDVGMTNSGSMALAHARGLPLYLIACGGLYSPAAPIAHVIVGKTSALRTPKDLAGKTIAVSTLRDMMQAAVMQWTDRSGGDSKAVNFIELPMVGMAAAIQSGRIDGAVVVEPIFSRVRDDVRDIGLPYVAVADGKPFQTLGAIANKSWADANPAVAKRCATALHQAAAWANRNHAECAELLGKYSKMDPALIAAVPRITFAEANNAAYVQPVIDLLTRYTILPHAYTAAELFAPGLA